MGAITICSDFGAHLRLPTIYQTVVSKLKHNKPKPMGLSKSSAKGKVNSNASLPQETREKSNK